MAIWNGINAFKDKFKNAAYNVRDHAETVATQMSQAVSEINVPLGYVKGRINLIYKDRANPLAVAVNAFYALAYLTFKNVGGQQAVLEEVIEAFSQINSAFSGLGNSFQNLGSETESAVRTLRNVISGSISRIGTAMLTFTESFEALGINLSNIFAGEIPEPSPPEPSWLPEKST